MVALTGKLSAWGTLLKCNYLAGDTVAQFRNVAYIRNISGPSLSLDTTDVTSHDSTNAWEEVVATVLRSGEITFDVIYDPAEDTIDCVDGLIYQIVNKVNLTFKIYFPNDTVEANRSIWILPGYCTGFEPSAPHDGALTGALKFKVSGSPTLV